MCICEVVVTYFDIHTHEHNTSNLGRSTSEDVTAHDKLIKSRLSSSLEHPVEIWSRYLDDLVIRQIRVDDACIIYMHRCIVYTRMSALYYACYLNEFMVRAGRIAWMLVCM